MPRAISIKTPEPLPLTIWLAIKQACPILPLINRHVPLLADARRSGITALPEFLVDVGLRKAPEPAFPETNMSKPCRCSTIPR
jgi:hypothetical protein